jgi:hypothetical protein
MATKQQEKLLKTTLANLVGALFANHLPKTTITFYNSPIPPAMSKGTRCKKLSTTTSKMCNTLKTNPILELILLYSM